MTDIKSLSYVYTQLKDLEIGKTYNVYGVVKYVTTPSKSKGSDYYRQISIIDPTYGNERLVCMIFNKEVQSLPECEVGDIIRLHRLKISEYNSKLQGKSAPNFAWLVFDPSINNDVIKPKAGSTEDFKLQPIDFAKIKELQYWLHANRPLNQTGKEVQFTTFSSVSSKEAFNIVVQVISRYNMNADLVVLRVWDGTKVNFPVQAFDVTGLKSGNISTNDYLHSRSKDYQYSVQIYDDHAAVARNLNAGEVISIMNIQSFPCEYTDSLGPSLPKIQFCLRGKSMPDLIKEIILAPPNFGPAQKLKKVLDRILEIPDMSLMNSEAFDCLMASSETCIRNRNTIECDTSSDPKTNLGNKQCLSTVFTNTNSQTTCENIAGQDMGISLKQSSSHDTLPTKFVGMSFVQALPSLPYLMQSASIIGDHRREPLSDLGAVLKNVSTNTFHVKVKVRDLFPHPKFPKYFISVYCSTCNYLQQLCETASASQVVLNQPDVPLLKCPVCASASDSNVRIFTPKLAYIFSVKFLLVDATGWLEANLWKDEANLFFNTTAEDLIRYPRNFQHLKHRVEALTSTDLKHCAWFECCLKSHNTAEVGRCFEIFDTQLGLSCN